MKHSNIFFKDLGTVSSRRTTKEGFLSVVADFARVGIQDYHVGELPRDQIPPDLRGDPFTIIRILRPEKEVFADASMQSFSQKPVTDDHPPEHINSKNFKDFQVGFSGAEVLKNQDRLRVPLLIQDAETIKKVKAGKDALSAGYSAQVVWSSGVDDVFGPYDAIQTGIEGNHIAIVDKARGGTEVRINDSWSEFSDSTKKPKETKKMAQRKINGVSIEFSDQGAEAVDGLLKLLADSEKSTEQIKKELKDQKAEIDRLKGELDVQKKAQLTDADIEAKVTERLQILDKARELNPDLDPIGKSLIDIRKEAITAVEKSFDLNDKSDEYVTAVFDAFYAKREKKGTKSARKAGENAGSGDDKVSIADQAREEFLKRSADAWKYPVGWTGQKGVE